MDFFTAFVEAFVGLLNIVGEMAKVVSLAARLFGNVFAGNVMVVVIIGLSAFTQFLVPIPFLVLSIFSGLVQAFVFTLLSIQFIALSIDGAMDEEEESQVVATATA
jgi:F-type H+-transporting ATPase subunit a